ncbi:MAG: VWA domain-containing protein [Thermodesulfobacteriota bacterium]
MAHYFTSAGRFSPRFFLMILLAAAALPLFFAAPPAAHAGSRLAVTSAFDNGYVLAAEPGERYLEVLVTAPERAGLAGRPRLPLNIALVIDSSGSMAHEAKMRHVKKAARAIVSRLRPDDRFALVTYANQARVLLSSQPMAEPWRARDLIRAIRPGGGTNLHAGLMAGYEELGHSCSSRYINRLILLSDGLANVGETSSHRLGQLALDQARHGISLSTFGVGLDFNENLLASLSEDGRGMYYFIDRAADIDRLLAREFQAVEQLVASDIQVTVKFASGLTVTRVMANRFTREGRRVVMSGGDLAAGQLRRFQIRLRPDEGRAGIHKVAKVQVSYLPMGGKKRLSHRQRVSLSYSDDAAFVRGQRHGLISERAAVFEAHHARSRAARAVDKGDMAQAGKILARAQRRLDHRGQLNGRLRREKKAINDYAQALKRPMDRRTRARMQKKVKYKSYALEGC